MSLSFDVETTAAGVQVVGPLDTRAAPLLLSALERVAVASGGSVEIDMARCSYVDSGGVFALVRAAHMMGSRGATVVLRAPNSNLLRKFDMLGLIGDAPFRVVA